MNTIILDFSAAARLLHKHNNAPRLTPTRCTECGRVFDLANETDAAEWAFGHDCETQPTKRQYKAGDKLIYTPYVDGVEFRAYAEHDPDGAYIYPLSGNGTELYVDIKTLKGFDNGN